MAKKKANKKRAVRKPVARKAIAMNATKFDAAVKKLVKRMKDVGTQLVKVTSSSKAQVASEKTRRVKVEKLLKAERAKSKKSNKVVRRKKK